MKEINYMYSMGESVFINYEDQVIMCKMNMVSFIEYCCRNYGSSISNSKEICKMILNDSQNLPILFSLRNDLIFLPTKAINNPKCILINSSRIQSLKSIDSKTCRVYFCDDTYADLNCSKTTVSNQIARAMQIRSFFGRNMSPIMKLRQENVIIV